jgi:tape measure domain-containing protein
MSKNVDRRIIVMEFDNAQFEREVKRSQSTLEKLKEFLNFDKQAESLTGISKAAKGVDMSGMAAGVEAVSERFSNLGIIGMTVIQELTKTALNFGKKLISGSIGQILSGGKKRALNVEQAAFQFKGLGVDVEKAMESARESVLGTMYGFDAAAKAGSQMAASGVDVGDDLYRALRAVAGVAAMTGSEFEDMAHIFTTVAGNGRLMGDQLNRIGARGLNAAAVLGKAMGISEGEVRDMVSKGQISFQMFADAMYEAFGDHATEASGLFAGSVAHVKAALSRIGGTFAPTIFENFKVTLIELRYAIDAVHNALKPYLPLFEKVVTLIAGKATAALTNFKDSFTNEDLAPYIDSMINIFKALISIAKPIGEAFRDIFPAMTLERFRSIGESIENFTSKLVLSEKNSENLKRTFRGLFAVLDIGKMIFTTIGQVILNAIGYFAPLGNVVLDVTGTFGDFLVSLRDVIAGSDTFEKVGLGIEKGFKPLKFVADTAIGLFKGILGFLQPLAPMISGIGNVIGDSVEGITGRISEFVQSLDLQQGLDLVNTGIFGTLLLVVNKFMGALELALVRGNIAQSFTLMMRKVRIALMEYQSYLKAKTLLAIAAAIAILVGSLVLLSSIDPERLGTAVMAMTVLLTQLFGSMAVFNKMLSGGGFKGITKVALAMLPLAVSILTLSSAIKKLSGIEWEAMKTGLAGLAGSMILLVGSAKVLSTIEGKMMKGAGGMIVFAAALIVMATAVEKFGSIDGGILKQGLVGVGVVLTELALFMKVTDLSGMGVLKGAGILLLATSMVVLSNAVSKFGEMDTNAMIQGLVGMGVVLTEIGIFMKVVGDPASMIVKANSLLVLGAALLLFSSTIRQVGGMETDDLKQALIGLAAGLTIMVVALNLLNGAIGGAAAMLVLAGALAVLAPTLMILGNMELSELGMALLAIAGVFGVLAVAGLLLGPVTPIILALSAALLLLGAAVGLIGGGIALLATGLGALAVAGTAGIATLTLLITSILGLIPVFLEQVARGILAFAKVIGEGAPALVEAIVNVIIALSEAVIETAPKVAEAFVTLVWNVLDALERVAPKFGESLIKIIGGLIEGMIQGVKDLLGISSPSSVFAEIASDIIGGLIKGLSDGISNVVESIKEVGRNILKGIKEFFGIRSPSTEFESVGGDVISGLIKGITSKPSEILNSAKEMGRKVMEGIENLPGDILESGKEVVSGFISGLGTNVKGVANAAKGLASRALSSIRNTLGIKSPSKVFEEVGEFTVQGFVDGLSGMSREIVDTAEEVGETSISALRDSISKAVDGELDLQPTISPVIDLSDMDTSFLDEFGKSKLDLRGTINKLPDDRISNRQNGSRNDATTVKVEKHYHLSLQALGQLPKHVIEQMAEDFDEAIKGLEDRNKINRGEGVVF